jgi:predicted ATPase
VAEGKRLLQNTRLLTLTGPGGIGKTRLSLRIAAESVEQFPAGVFFVPLSAVRDPELVASSVAQVLGVPVAGARTPIESVVEHLHDKTILLVLDNFEQLLPDGAAAAAQLLQSGPGVKLMVSSRSVLHVYGEQEFGVEPLGLPGRQAHLGLDALRQYEAVKLFIERAVAVKPDFTVTNENAPAIAGICERVDGLPLAIELAAARIKLFSPQALLHRLETSLTALGSGARDLPGRQQTLRGAIDWSYQMLDEKQKRLLNRFSVFARGASLEQAELVCGSPEDVGDDVLSGLDELADKSLLRRQPDFDEPRLLMLQTIREFAGERLEESGEAQVIRNRHADALSSLAKAAAPNLFGEDQKMWLDRLELDHDNFRVALDWCVAERDAERAQILGGTLWRFWQMRGHLHEGRARLTAILAMPESKRIPDSRARALEAAGGIAYWHGDMPAAQAFYDECLALRQAGDDRRELANAYYNASFPSAVNVSDLPKSEALLEQALPIYRELADEAGISGCQWAIGNLLYFRKSYDHAIIALDEAIVLFRKGGNRFGLGWALHTRSLCALRTGDVAGARNYIREALQLFLEARDVSGISLLLDDAGEAVMAEGNRSGGIQLAAAAAAQQATSGAGLGSILNLEEGRSRHDYVSGEDDERAWVAGHAMTLEQAVALALDQLTTKEKI